MATNPVGSWLSGGGVTGRGGAPGPVTKAAATNPIVQQLQTGAPLGQWGDMGMQKQNVAALTPFTPPVKAMPSGPPPIAEMMKAQGPSPMASIAQAMAPQGPEPETYSDPYEAAKQARRLGRPAPPPPPPPVPPPPMAAPPAAAVQPPPQVQPSIAQNMAPPPDGGFGGIAQRMGRMRARY